MPSVQELLTKNTATMEALHADLSKVEKALPLLEEALHHRIDAVEAAFKRSPRGDGDGTGSGYRDIKSDAYVEWLKTGDPSELKALQVGDDSEGGVLVSPAISNTILQRITEISPIRAVAAVTEITTDSWEEPHNLNNTSAEWVGEEQSRGETGDPSFGKHRIPVHELHAQVKVTQKLLDDSPHNIETFLAERFATEFSRAENAAFVNGNGVAKPRGFLDYAADASTADDDSRAWGTLQYVPTGQAATFDSTNPADVLHDLVSKLKVAYRANARWLMNRSTHNTLAKFKAGDGDYLLSMGDVTRGIPQMLLGFPIVLAEDLADVGADAFPIAFGDFRRGYRIIDRVGIRTLRDPFTSKPFVLLDATRRVGGDIIDFDSIKLVKVASS